MFVSTGVKCKLCQIDVSYFIHGNNQRETDIYIISMRAVYCSVPYFCTSSSTYLE